MFVYRLLLLLCPAAFRVQYDEELSSVVSLKLREASNFAVWIAIWIEAVRDIVFTAVVAHWDILSQDLRYTVRVLRRSPGFALTAIAVAAIGVGATTAAYTITDHVLLRPLPFPEPDRLVKLWEDMSPGSYNEMEPSPASYRDWKTMSKSFEGMAASRGLSASMIGVGEPEQIEGASVTADLFPLLGATAAIGRLLSPEDDQPGAPGTVVLSNGFWQARFAGDKNVVGRRILLDATPYVVIGVMKPGFDFPRAKVQLWTAMRFGNQDFEDRNNNYLRVVARLRPGVSVDQARSEMQVISAQLKREYPKDNEHVGVTIGSLRDEVPNRSRLMLIALLAASSCVLLIACTNLANLLLARALARRKELAVRTALGAGRERLVRQMLTESLLLALIGGLLGVVIAGASVPLLSKLVPSSLPIAATPTIDARVLLFALGLTVLTGICFGLIPAARVASGGTANGLREGGRQGVGGKKEHLRSALVVTEIAISFMLLVCTGLLFRALVQLQATNPGFRSENVLTLRTALPSPQYDSTSRRVQFYDRVLAAVRQLPGVSSAGYISFLPIEHPGGIWPVSVPPQAANSDRAFHQASLRFVTPGYFETLGIPLLRGRAIRESDTDKTQIVAVVSESFVREYWPDQDPVGRQFGFGFATRTVVGVVGDVRVRGFERSSEPQVYLSYKQVPDGGLIWYAPKDLAIRSRLDGGKLLPSVRQIIAETDSQLPISDVQTLEHIVSEATAPRLVQIRVLGGFALIAVLLAAIGIHGLLSFTVSNRTQEIGVRMALGAKSGDVVWMVMRDGILLAVTGTVVGIALAEGAGRTLASLLAGIDPSDLRTYGAGLGLALVMTLGGSMLPVLRALRVDPVSAMRAE